jgi:phosphoglucomutase
VPEQRVAFGASGHRGSAFEKSFDERYILAISQTICLYRERKKIDGRLFLGMDTHALTAKLGRKLYEVPVGFKWFVNG